jgi:hypothetical protein
MNSVVLVLNEPSRARGETACLQEHSIGYSTWVPARAICEKNSAGIADSGPPSSTGTTGAVPLSERPAAGCQLLLTTARYSCTAGVSRIVRGAQQALPADPASRASCSWRPSPQRRWRRATASSTNSRYRSTSRLPRRQRTSPDPDTKRTRHGKLLISAPSQRVTREHWSDTGHPYITRYVLSRGVADCDYSR